MPQKHILFTCPAFPPFPGGGERYTADLAARLASRGFKISILTSTAIQESDFWRGSRLPGSLPRRGHNPLLIPLPLKSVPGGRNGLLWWRKVMVVVSSLPGSQSGFLLRLSRLYPPIIGMDVVLEHLKDQIDLVHGFNMSWENPLMAGWRFAREIDVPFVVTPFAHLGEGGRDRVALNSTMDHQREVLADADALITLTSIESRELIQREAAPAMIEVVGAGLEPLPQVANPRQIVSNLEIPTPFFLFIGRASFDKGALHAAEAILQLNKNKTQAALVIIGQSSKEFARFYNKLKPSEKSWIRPLGIVDESTKHGLLQQALALTLPSRTDSFGIVLLEAWAHGKPVVAAKAGGIPGVVADGYDGLLVKFGDVSGLVDAFRFVLGNSQRAREMGERGRLKVAELYNWDLLSDRVIAVYERLL